MCHLTDQKLYSHAFKGRAGVAPAGGRGVDTSCEYLIVTVPPPE